jgi:hypothetical protein
MVKIPCPPPPHPTRPTHCGQVRSAGDDAWLGRPAPYVPALDGPLEDGEEDVSASSAQPAPLPLHAPLVTTAAAALPSRKTGGGSSSVATSRAGIAAASAGGGDRLASFEFGNTVAALKRQRTSFRSVKEAVAAARDGDRILLRSGAHNGMG